MMTKKDFFGSFSRINLRTRRMGVTEMAMHLQNLLKMMKEKVFSRNFLKINLMTRKM